MKYSHILYSMLLIGCVSSEPSNGNINSEEINALESNNDSVDSDSTTILKSNDTIQDIIKGIDPSTCFKYDRTTYKHWISIEGNCSNVREHVLNIENREGENASCDVTTGTWVCPFTGDTLYKKGDVDIDHLVPLKEADVSGAYSWSEEKKEQYANFLEDEYHLIAVDDGSNQSKSDKDPGEWLPSKKSYHKEYVLNWIAVKVKWDLTADQQELKAIKEILGADTIGVKFPIEAMEVHCNMAQKVNKSDESECGNKKYCGDMNSCDEAKYFLNTCGITSLDADNDGTPCESICK